MSVITKQYYTVTTLPAAAAHVGEVQWITDSDENDRIGRGKIAVGSGTHRARVLSDGTNWRLYN
jgi:hypothetical protein